MAYPADWFPCPDVHCFTSKKKARKYARKHYDVDLTILDSMGQTTALVNGNRTACIVIVPKKKDVSKAQRAALLAHECWHVVHAWLDMMKDGEMSEEFIAYAVGCTYMVCIEQLGDEWL